jgi:site-specific recombinase XerD
VFVSERGRPISPIGFHRLGEAAKMPFPIHPHMLRHTCGFKPANDGHDTRALEHCLGHKNIQHTVRYTEMAPDRFKDFGEADPSARFPTRLGAAGGSNTESSSL